MCHRSSNLSPTGVPSVIRDFLQKNAFCIADCAHVILVTTYGYNTGTSAFIAA